MWDESESDKRARIHREQMETAQRLGEEANEIGRRQADLLEEQAYHAANSAHHAFRIQETVAKLHQTEELRLKEERRHRLEEQQAAVRRAGLPEFSESFQQEWLRLNRLLDKYWSEAARRDTKVEEAEATIETHKRNLQFAEQRLRAKIENSLKGGEPFGPRALAEFTASLQQAPGMADVIAVRTEIQSQGLLQEPKRTPRSLADLAREISITQQLASSLRLQRGYRQEGWPYFLGSIGALFLLVALVCVRLLFIRPSGQINPTPLSTGLGAAFVSFLLSTAFFSPLLYFWSRNARIWSKLLSLHRWASACEEVASELGLRFTSSLPTSDNRRDWPGWPDYCSGAPIAETLEAILAAIISQISAHMIGRTGDATANEILALRTEIDRLAAGQDTDYQRWIAGQDERKAQYKHWEFFRDQLEQVGKEIVAGHRLPGRQITLLECPSCGGLITSESTRCSHCARLISTAGNS